MRKKVFDLLDPHVLGQRLQEARRAAGLTQEAVAAPMDMARTTVVAIEKGERRLTPEELIRFAKAYGRQVSDFVGRTIVARGLRLSFVPSNGEKSKRIPSTNRLRSISSADRRTTLSWSVSSVRL